MRRFNLSAALLIVIAGGTATAQISPGQRPIRMIAPPDSNAATPMAAMQKQMADMQQQIASLSAQVNDQKKQIAQLQSSLQTTAIKGFDNAGKLEALRVAFVHHDHFYTFATQSGGNQKLQTTRVTPPSIYCKQVGTSGIAIDQYQCGDGY